MKKILAVRKILVIGFGVLCAMIGMLGIASCVLNIREIIQQEVGLDFVLKLSMYVVFSLMFLFGGMFLLQNPDLSIEKI